LNDLSDKSSDVSLWLGKNMSCHLENAKKYISDHEQNP